MKTILKLTALATIGMLSLTACNSTATKSEQSGAENAAQSGKPGGPKLGEKPRGGMVIDKSNDAELQQLIKEVVPQFTQHQYVDTTSGDTIRYNLFTPKDLKVGETYPLVLFIADASTPGDDVQTPLKQGYGALVWATDDWQKEYPSYVLVPQFSGVAVNDAYEHTSEVDAVARLVENFAKNNAVDANRLYTTGQSMGGMISMYYNVTYPDLFAASIFVDSHWNTATFPELVKHKFVYFIAGDQGKAYTQIEPLEEAARAEKINYTFTEWSAQLPEAEQDALANVMFEKHAPINLIEFEPKSVLPADGKGSEHMYSFDYAYKIKAVRQWLFRQSK